MDESKHETEIFQRFYTYTKHRKSINLIVLALTVSTHFSSNSFLFGTLQNSQLCFPILAKSDRIGHASFTSETRNVRNALAPR